VVNDDDADDGCDNEDSCCQSGSRRLSCYVSYRLCNCFCIVSDIAIFVLKRDVKLQLTNCFCHIDFRIAVCRCN